MSWLEVEHLLEQMVAEGRLHLVDVERLPGPRDPTVMARFVAACTCGWRSADHEFEVALTGWEEEDARRLAEYAGLAHVCGVPDGGDQHE